VGVLAAAAGLMLASCAPPWLGARPALVPIAATQSAAPAATASATAPAGPPAPPLGAQAPVTALVPYTGSVRHIFFHPLVAYPSRAFGHRPMAAGMDEWFITVDEFRRILPQLYANGYILVDVHDLFRERSDGGKTVLAPKQLMLPPGKKPLILSVDDINYYQYMQQNGTVDQLVLDANGQVAAYSVDSAGRAVISREDAIVPILDQFVAAHPDFSWHGAKGLLNVTGYQGILGYRTGTGRTASPDQAAAQQDARAVVQRLEATGWTFAAHGWGHLNAQTVSYATLVRDTLRWVAEVEPLVGKTDVYVYPFGASLVPGSRKFDFLLSQGFHIFFGVGPRPALHLTSSYLTMDRVHVDGLALETQPKMLAPYFAAGTVLDRAARGR